LRNAISFEASEELRSDPITNCEEKEQKDEAFERAWDGDVELADEHASQKTRRYITEVESTEFERSDKISDRQC
jgi:hypothetical protein